MGCSSNIFKRKNEASPVKPYLNKHFAEDTTFFASIFRRKIKGVNSIEAPDKKIERQATIVDDFKLERTFSLNSSTGGKNGPKKTRSIKTSAKNMDWKEKDEEELLRGIFLETLNSINIETGIQKILSKKKEKKQRLMMMGSERELQDQENEIFIKFAKNKFSSRKQLPEQNKREMLPDEKEAQCTEEEIVEASALKINARKSNLMSPSNQAHKALKEIQQVADLKKNPEIDEVIRASPTPHYSIINRNDQMNGLIRVHDKAGLAKIQRDLIKLKRASDSLNVLPYLNKQKQGSKKRTLKILENNHLPLHITETDIQGRLISPKSNSFKIMGTLVKEEYISQSKQLFSTLPLYPTSPSARESPKRFSSQNCSPSPVISPIHKSLNYNSFSSTISNKKGSAFPEKE